MKLNANKLFISTALAVAIVWLVCAAFVAILPVGMMTMTGHMVHTDTQHMAWTLSTTGVLAGLVAWSISAGFLTWIGATIYNLLDGK